MKTNNCGTDKVSLGSHNAQSRTVIRVLGASTKSQFFNMYNIHLHLYNMQGASHTLYFPPNYKHENKNKKFKN